MTFDPTITTLHGVQRAKERCNLKSIRTAEKQISLALKRGKCAEDCSSWERDYLEREAYDDCIAIAYNNFCYIVNSRGICVTLYPLPSWFGKKKQFNGKERIRNAKQYSRHHAVFDRCEMACC